MKNAFTFVTVFLVMFLAALACGSLARMETTPQVETGAGTDSNLPTVPVIPIATATTEKLQLEIIQFQAWTDRDGNVRVNALMRNPYDFPVAPTARARLVNGAGESIRDQDLYFLDGISGGNGFFLPGETVAANVCFTCERTLELLH